MSATPHQIAWNEARSLLAQAERARESRDPAQLGGAVATTDSAIALLQRLAATSDHPAPRRLLAAAWSLRARLHAEANPSQPNDETIRAYETAVACLRQTPKDADLQVRADLALALHQLGNARQQRDAASDRRAALADYDEALQVLGELPLENAAGLQHVCGTVWLNRGALCVRMNDPASPGEALRSFDAAIQALRSADADSTPSQRVNLAAAWMNRAHGLLRVREDVVNAREARVAVREALTHVRERERDNTLAADVGLKARHIACRALGLLLAAPEIEAAAKSELSAEALDLAEEGLDLARHWLQRKAPMPLPFVHDLFRFGAQTYLTQQPHFLAEFVLENLDPETSVDALPWHPALDAVATEAVTRALQSLERPQFHVIDAPGTDRRIQSLHDLRRAAERLQAIRTAASAR